MIYICPFCGHQLRRELVDGLTACNHCNRMIDSSVYNKLLSGFWVIKQQPHIDFEKFKFHSGLSEAEAIIAYAFANDHCYSLDEFQKALKTIGVASKIGFQQSA